MASRKRNKKPIRIFASDLDGTILGKLDATHAFRETWEKHSGENKPLLCYCTGRMLSETLGFIEEKLLPKPDYLICGVGTLIYDYRKRRELKSFSGVLEEGWDVRKVEELMRNTFPEAVRQAAYYQSKYKSSWFLNGASEQDIAKLDEVLADAGLNVTLVYSSQRDLDVLPKYANKGNALSWLLQHLDIPREQALVAGDTGNDAAMILKKGIHSIVVGNAQPELLEAVIGHGVFMATENYADGVLEGLKEYGVIKEVIYPEDTPDARMLEAGEHESLQRFMQEEAHTRISKEDQDFLNTACEKAVDGLQRNITPMGFSACSLDDNETRGTDANYRSVWARDGSISILGALLVDDPELRDCCRQTLVTLLDHVSPPGQIPANVSIDNGEPDYSGVGGICSIDSGLWVIIAFYEYIRASNDLDLLRRYRETLQRAMDWLSAHDSNNDALIEVPEAGDWTDLFGRSYNILYDEVLWFQANLSFGRMLELLGEWKRAGDYIRWSGTIKSAILHKFWPSTNDVMGSNYSFADKQLSLGDTNYLIAQVTPFDFDWRCDVYGNILAALYNVLDIDRAKIAFRFMWGVGVNDPYPVNNLYPVVQAGDPGWRHYYTVNLLNLPHHYHNGGIWPFVGAQWVRFIYRLGLRDIAQNELIRLARINQAGIQHEWEFNEWAHGQTGKPMGKAYQAWSCSEFIRTCHDMHIVPKSCLKGKH